MKLLLVSEGLGRDDRSALVLENTSFVDHSVASEGVAFNVEAATEGRFFSESGGAKGGEESKSPSTEDASIVLESVGEDEGLRRVSGWIGLQVDIDYNWAFDTSAVSDCVVEELDFSEVVMNVDNCLNEISF